MSFQRYERQYANWQEVKEIYREEQTREFRKRAALQKELISSRDTLRELKQREEQEYRNKVWCQPPPPKKK